MELVIDENRCYFMILIDYRIVIALMRDDIMISLESKGCQLYSLDSYTTPFRDYFDLIGLG